MPDELRQKSVELLNYAGQTPANSVAEATLEIAAGIYQTKLYTVIANGVTQKSYISEALPRIVLTETEGLRMELTATAMMANLQSPQDLSDQHKIQHSDSTPDFRPVYRFFLAWRRVIRPGRYTPYTR